MRPAQPADERNRVQGWALCGGVIGQGVEVFLDGRLVSRRDLFLHHRLAGLLANVLNGAQIFFARRTGLGNLPRLPFHQHPARLEQRCGFFRLEAVVEFSSP